MEQNPKEHRLGYPFHLPARIRWIFWPVVTLSGGGAAVALWRQEEVILLADCAPIAAIPGLAALLYWFNHCVFKAAMPRSEDMKTLSTRNNSFNKKG